MLLSYCEAAVSSDCGVPDMWDIWAQMVDGYSKIAIGQDELLEKMKNAKG